MNISKRTMTDNFKLPETLPSVEENADLVSKGHPYESSPCTVGASESSILRGKQGVHTRTEIQDNVQQFVDEINSKRKQDTQLLENFKKELDNHVKDVLGTLEQKMFMIYANKGEVIQEKLAELYATLDRISILEAELEQFREGLGVFYQSISEDK